MPSSDADESYEDNGGDNTDSYSHPEGNRRGEDDDEGDATREH